jgi:hypothetical protein
MNKKYCIIENKSKYYDAGCYGTKVYTDSFEWDSFDTKAEAQEYLEKLYDSFIIENNRPKQNYKGYRYEKIRKNVWKKINEYDFWHNHTYYILNYSIVRKYID